jgi:SAM-dependent methyltransferase
MLGRLKQLGFSIGDRAAKLVQPLADGAALALDRYYRYDTNRRWNRSNQPEWFDMRAGLYRTFTHPTGYMWERGVYTREVIPSGAKMLDLCSGDGFFPFVFYADQAALIHAVDWDPTAIAHATRHYSHPSITFQELNIVTDPLPVGPFEVVSWNAAIEHFALDEIDKVLGKVAAILVPGGILHGYTILNSGAQMHPDHRHEFQTADELRAVLGRRFRFVSTLETTYPDRHNIYFRAAQAANLGGWT